MTDHLRPTGIHVPAETLAAAAIALTRSGCWQQAADLLDATTATTPDDLAVLSHAAAEAALDSDWRTGSRLAPPALAMAQTAADATGDPERSWDVELLQVRQDYADQLFIDGSTPHFGPEGRDLGRVAALRGHVERLHDDAPDRSRKGWAAMYLVGLIDDNLLADRSAAPDHYATALACAVEVGDDLLTKEANRHLGDHDHDDGHVTSARQRWEQATEASARAGDVPGVLAQQLLLAVLDQEAGDPAGAAALVREVERWSGALGASRLRAQAQAFLAGADPTAPPPEAATR